MSDIDGIPLRDLGVMTCEQFGHDWHEIHPGDEREDIYEECQRCLMIRYELKSAP